MIILPTNVVGLLKVGIFHYGSEDLNSFLQTSTLLGYNWIEDDSESDKRERVIETINGIHPMTHPRISFTARQILSNLISFDIRWESLPPSVQEAFIHLFSTLSAPEVEFVKRG
jgi:hypothetical protein